MRIKRKNKHSVIIEDDDGEIEVPRVQKYMNNDGNSAKVLMELAINEIRENRQEINYVKSKLMKGTGKIAANRQAVTDMNENLRSERRKTYIGAGTITLILNFLKEVGIYLWR